MSRLPTNRNVPYAGLDSYYTSIYHNDGATRLIFYWTRQDKTDNLKKLLAKLNFDMGQLGTSRTFWINGKVVVNKGLGGHSGFNV